VAVCYLLYPPLHGANLYDFHYLTFAPFFLWLTLWALDARRDRLAARCPCCLRCARRSGEPRGPRPLPRPPGDGPSWRSRDGGQRLVLQAVSSW
jgi:hypothetical protein